MEDDQKNENGRWPNKIQNRRQSQWKKTKKITIEDDQKIETEDAKCEVTKTIKMEDNQDKPKWKTTKTNQNGRR